MAGNRSGKAPFGNHLSSSVVDLRPPFFLPSIYCFDLMLNDSGGNCVNGRAPGTIADGNGYLTSEMPSLYGPAISLMDITGDPFLCDIDHYTANDGSYPSIDASDHYLLRLIQATGQTCVNPTGSPSQSGHDDVNPDDILPAEHDQAPLPHHTDSPFLGFPMTSTAAESYLAEQPWMQEQLFTQWNRSPKDRFSLPQHTIHQQRFPWTEQSNHARCNTTADTLSDRNIAQRLQKDEIYVFGTAQSWDTSLVHNEISQVEESDLACMFPWPDAAIGDVSVDHNLTLLLAQQCPRTASDLLLSYLQNSSQQNTDRMITLPPGRAVLPKSSSPSDTRPSTPEEIPFASNDLYGKQYRQCVLFKPTTPQSSPPETPERIALEDGTTAASVNGSLKTVTDTNTTMEEKPLHSYAALIVQALVSTESGCMSLSEVYQWILTTYPYFKTSGPRWQVCLRCGVAFTFAELHTAQPLIEQGVH